MTNFNFLKNEYMEGVRMKSIVYFVFTVLIVLSSACKSSVYNSTNKTQVKPATKEEIADNAYKIYNNYAKKSFNLDGVDQAFYYSYHGKRLIQDIIEVLDPRVNNTKQALLELDKDKDILRENDDLKDVMKQKMKKEIERDSVLLDYCKNRKFTNEDVQNILKGKDKGYLEIEKKFSILENEVRKLNYELLVRTYAPKFTTKTLEYESISDKKDKDGYLMGLWGNTTKEHLFIASAYCYFTDNYKSNGETIFPSIFTKVDKNKSIEEQAREYFKNVFLISVVYVKNTGKESVVFDPSSINFSDKRKENLEIFHNTNAIREDYPVDFFRSDSDFNDAKKELKPNEDALFYNIYLVDRDTKLVDMWAGVQDEKTKKVYLAFPIKRPNILLFKK